MPPPGPLDQRLIQPRQYKPPTRLIGPFQAALAHLQHRFYQIYRLCAEQHPDLHFRSALPFPEHHLKSCDYSPARGNRHAESQRFPAYLPAGCKFRHPPPHLRSPLYQRRIGKIAETARVLAFHCAKPGPSHSAETGLATHCETGRNSGPRAPSNHTAGPANRLPLPAMQKLPHLGAPHLAEICPKPQPFPPRWFQAPQTRSGDKPLRFAPALHRVAPPRVPHNLETLLGFAPWGAGFSSLWPYGPS